MRILHIVSNISLYNGIMAVLMNYNRHLESGRIIFDFLFFEKRKSTYFEEIKKLGGECYFVESPSTNLISFRKQWINFCENHKSEYSIVHIHEIYMAPFIIDLRKRLDTRKVIIHSHAAIYSDTVLKSYRNKIMSKFNYFIADEYWACSIEAGKRLLGNKFDSNGFVMQNAIDLEKFAFSKKKRVSMREKLGLKDEFVIGHIGQFTPVKNHFFLIEVFEKILEVLPDSKLILIGDGDKNYVNNVLLFCKQKGIIDNIIYLGERKDVHNIIHTFDRFVFPSIYEGLGISLIEAQAAGIPCVFSNGIPISANIIKEKNTICSLNDSINSWTKAILKNYGDTDVDIAEKIKEAGFDIKTATLKLQEKYENILQK